MGHGAGIPNYHNRFLEKLEAYLASMQGQLNSIIGLLGSTNADSTVIARGTASTVADNAITTIVTYTNSGSVLWVDSVVATGDVDAQFDVVIDTVTKFTYRTSEQDRTMNVPLPTALKIADGSIVDIKVTHFNTSVTGNFSASIIGHRGA